MPTAAAFLRTPLVITAGDLVAGPVHATFRDGDRESLLHSYLVLVRELRGQQREPSITLRSDDICAIADHLGVSEQRVLDDLLDRMGATRAQRRALLAMFALGALSIVATGSVAIDPAPAGAYAQGSSDVAPVIEAVDATSVPAMSSVDDALADDALVVRAETRPLDAVPEPELAVAIGGAEWELMVSVQQLAHALSTPSAADLGVAPALDQGVGVADDGSVVAVAEPPVPMQEGVGVADDGSVVAVGEPPVPMQEGVGVADDGSVVAVAEPPVPMQEGVGVADDGSVVAVAEPPVP